MEKIGCNYRLQVNFNFGKEFFCSICDVRCLHADTDTQNNKIELIDYFRIINFVFIFALFLKMLQN